MDFFFSTEHNIRATLACEYDRVADVLERHLYHLRHGIKKSLLCDMSTRLPPPPPATTGEVVSLLKAAPPASALSESSIVSSSRAPATTGADPPAFEASSSTFAASILAASRRLEREERIYLNELAQFIGSMQKENISPSRLPVASIEGVIRIRDAPLFVQRYHKSMLTTEAELRNLIGTEESSVFDVLELMMAASPLTERVVLQNQEASARRALEFTTMLTRDDILTQSSRHIARKRTFLRVSCREPETSPRKATSAVSSKCSLVRPHSSVGLDASTPLSSFDLGTFHSAHLSPHAGRGNSVPLATEGSLKRVGSGSGWRTPSAASLRAEKQLKHHLEELAVLLQYTAQAEAMQRQRIVAEEVNGFLERRKDAHLEHLIIRLVQYGDTVTNPQVGVSSKSVGGHSWVRCGVSFTEEEVTRIIASSLQQNVTAVEEWYQSEKVNAEVNKHFFDAETFTLLRQHMMTHRRWLEDRAHDAHREMEETEAMQRRVLLDSMESSVLTAWWGALVAYDASIEEQGGFIVQTHIARMKR